MANSTGGLFRRIEICEGAESLCLPIGWEVVYLLLAAVTVAANILHMVVLRKTNLHKQRFNYYIILTYVNFMDIFTSIDTFLSKSCWFRTAIYGQPVLGTAFFSAWSEASIDMQYFSLAFASFERYIALCKPYRYDTNIVVNHVGKIMATTYGILFGGLLTMNLVLSENTCIDYTIGPYMMETSAAADSVLAVVVVSLAPPIIVTIVTTYKIGRELRRMKARSLSCDDEAVKRAAIYTLSVIAAFLICLLPDFTVFLVTLFVQLKVEFLLTAQVCLGCYGIVNVIIYGGMFAGYRRTITKMCKCDNSVTQS